MVTLTRELAAYLCSLRYEDLPQAVVEKAKHQLTYMLGQALAGYRTDMGTSARELAAQLSPHGGNSTVIGEAFTVHPIDGAFANAGTMGGSEHDDFFVTPEPSMGTHPGILTHPVAWAVGEQVKSTGKQLLTAVVGGYEFLSKLGRLAWAPSAAVPTRQRQIVPISPFGSTAVAAKLLGLSVDETAVALGYAANFAMGISEGAVVPHYYALVCRNGIMAALLARSLAVSETPSHEVVAPTVLEGQNGLFRMYFGEVPEGLHALVDRLERDRVTGSFDILQASIKTHPGSALNVVPVQLMTQLVQRNREAVTADSVSAIEVYLAEQRAYHTASQFFGPYSNVADATSALPFMLAVILLDGYTNPRRYEQFDDQQLAEIASRVTLSFEPGHNVEYARLAVRTRDGGAHLAEADQFVSTLPSDHTAWLHEKNAGVIPDENIDRLADIISNLETVENVSAVMACLAPQRPAR